MQYIWHYGSTVNYVIDYNETTYKYLFKALYKCRKKKNISCEFGRKICNIPMLAIKNVIILEKTGKNEKFSKVPADIGV